MLTIPPSVRVFVARSSIDMRRSFDGLVAEVMYASGHPMSAALRAC